MTYNRKEPERYYIYTLSKRKCNGAGQMGIYRIGDKDIDIITRALRETAMSDCDGMKEACWENVHEGADWEPIADGFMKSITPRLQVHDSLVNQKAEQSTDSERARALDGLSGSKAVREYMNDILNELKKAATDGRRGYIHIVK